MIVIGNANRRQIANPRIRISVFYQFGSGAFDSGEWRKYFDDRRISPMCIIFPAVLCETRTDIIHDNWLQFDLRNGFERVSRGADVRHKYAGFVSMKRNSDPEIVVDELYYNADD